LARQGEKAPSESIGNHSWFVPTDKLNARFPRTLNNLKQAIQELPCVLIFDNDDLRTPYRLTAVFQDGRPAFLAKSVPAWLEQVVFRT
jgi:predicted ABC-type ATPase